MDHSERSVAIRIQEEDAATGESVHAIGRSDELRAADGFQRGAIHDFGDPGQNFHDRQRRIDDRCVEPMTLELDLNEAGGQRADERTGDRRKTRGWILTGVVSDLGPDSEARLFWPFR